MDSAQGVEAGAFLKGEGLLKGWVSRRCGSLEEVADLFSVVCDAVVLSKPQEAAPVSDIGHAPSVDFPSPIPLSQYLAKLSDVCLSVDVTRASVNISVNTVHKSVAA